MNVATEEFMHLSYWGQENVQTLVLLWPRKCSSTCVTAARKIFLFGYFFAMNVAWVKRPVSDRVCGQDRQAGLSDNLESEVPHIVNRKAEAAAQ